MKNKLELFIESLRSEEKEPATVVEPIRPLLPADIENYLRALTEDSYVIVPPRLSYASSPLTENPQQQLSIAHHLKHIRDKAITPETKKIKYHGANTFMRSQK